MALVGVGLDFTSIVSIVSVAFALTIVRQSYIVYRRTDRANFLALSVAFTLLAISYALLIPLAFGVKLPTIGYETNDILTYPPRIVIASIGLIIIALSYTPTPRVKQILYGLIVLLFLFVALVMVPQGPVVSPSVDGLLFLLHVGLLAYVLCRMWQIAKPIELVPLGFLILLVSQCIELIGSLQVGEVTFLLAQAIRLLSFALLFAALVKVTQSKTDYQKTGTKLR
ncbi:MAG TPA: hypothetical protein VNE86_02415 [Nitrososphaerales archaeon]|nr:hypothetical protein [Nitrososphaerales archaeon]